MAQFKTVDLTGERVLVSGTDNQGNSGQTVLYATQWNDIKAHAQVAEATAEFDAAVEAFFEPLNDALTKLESSQERPSEDPISFVVFDEGEEGTPGREATVVQLNQDSIVLRLLEEGGEDRLVWVNDSLEVTAEPTKKPRAKRS